MAGAVSSLNVRVIYLKILSDNFGYHHAQLRSCVISATINVGKHFLTILGIWQEPTQSRPSGDSTVMLFFTTFGVLYKLRFIMIIY